MGKHGYLGVSLPEEYGGGGGGIGDLAAVLEEAATAGAPLLLMVVSPAICGTIIARYGTEEQKQRWVPGIADGSITMAFAITEPDAGSNSHKITTTATKDGDDYVLNGGKTYISGVDEADYVLVVSRMADAKTGNLKPALIVVPTDAKGFEARVIPMTFTAPENQFTLHLDDVRVPADSLVGDPDHADAGLLQLFAGLNPERIMGAAMSLGTARYALDRAVEYAKTRSVWKDQPIGTHQGIAHPLAKTKIELEQARLLHAEGGGALRRRRRHRGGGVRQHGEVRRRRGGLQRHRRRRAHPRRQRPGPGVRPRPDAAVGPARPDRPVSREMILNYVAMHSLGLPKSY